MAMIEKKLTYGNITGTPFPEYTNIKTLALAGYTFLDRIIINGVTHGGPGGTLTKTITLSDGEFFNGITLRSGGVIDMLSISTNKHQNLRSRPENVDGIGGGILHCALHEGRLLGLSGMVGHFPGLSQAVICRLTFRVLMPDPPIIKDDCTLW